MSQAPHVIRGARWGLPLGKPGPLEDSLFASLSDSYTGMPMAITAENLAEKYELTREMCDAYALRSQQAWGAAHAAGRFKAELAPVEVKTRKGTITVTTDEHPRADASLEALAKLAPVFKKDGVVTAGNASGICDGAGALVLASREAAERRGWKPLARRVQWGVTGCDPKIMGIGPAPAIRLLLERSGLHLDEIDRFEVNEAQAAQVLAVQRELQLDPQRLNQQGGSIALGHPLAATGLRLTLSLARQLRAAKQRYGIAAACIGGGQGMAVLIENPAFAGANSP
jgi:acetyl-CoA acyltransferase 2